VIGAFLERYKKEYDFYDRAARLVRERLEASLGTSGVRCIVTSRAKDPSRLGEKVRQRNSSEKYSSVDQIFDSIVDLAGVRVALYFPGERDLVDGTIVKLFRLTEERKDFPKEGKQKEGKRFSGYSARHYRVHLKEEGLSQSDRRYLLAKVEIQVASVLMHAWSEVEHDLEYKPMEGELSEEEKAILDQLNGMVLAGEIALESLQRAGKRRVAESGNRFENHFELAAYLLSEVGDIEDKQVDEAGLGQVDDLFKLLRRTEIDTPKKLRKYLDSLHGNLELRPVSEQIIDTILAENPSYLEVYQTIQHESGKYSSQDEEVKHDDVYQQIGLFLESWWNLEHLTVSLPFYSANLKNGTPILQLVREVEKRGDSSLAGELGAIRRLRNELVHRGSSTTLPSSEYLVQARRQLDWIIGQVRQQFETNSEDN
jgi:ppGpp synthetase/RelA/SpoT-type nucleotidyltranferase